LPNEVAGFTFASAPFTMLSIEMERCVTFTYSFSNSCVPLRRMMAFTASRSPPLSAEILIAPPGLVWYCSASCPATNTALPLAEMQVSREFEELDDSAMSPSLPPQPMVAPSLPFDCHTDCWSLCENSLGGSGLATRLVLWYCARVVGWISGPTLSCT